MKTFFDFFPTPKFLDMPAPGLALTDSGLTFIEFGTNTKGFLIKRYGAAQLPKGLIENGVILDQEALIHALEDFRKSFNLRYIRTSLPEERAYLFQTLVPKVSEQDLRTAVEATIEENVPLSVSEVTFDYSVLPAQAGVSEDKVLVSVSVVPEALVLEYLSVFRDAGFVPLHFDIESQAVAKSLVKPSDAGVSLIVNLNQTKAGLYIVSQGAVNFTSTISIVSPSSQTSVGAVSSTYPGLSALMSEIKRVFLYWETKADREKHAVPSITKIILCGDEAFQEGVAGYISKELDIKVELGNVWTNVFSFDEYIPSIPLKDSLAYAPAVGLALSRDYRI